MNFKTSSEDIEPYLVDVLVPRQKRTLNLLISIWFIANLSFLAWWVQPSHYTDLLRFSLNTLVIFWITIVPIYYFYFLRKMTKPNPAIESLKIGGLRWLRPVYRHTNRGKSRINA